MYWFLSGFTAKLAGTEIGVTEPQPTFSTCFGAPFIPQRPVVYAELLGEKLDRPRRDGVARQHRLDRWAVRRRAAGCRSADPGAPDARPSPASSTTWSYRVDPVFGFDVPLEVPGVDTASARPALDVGGPGRVRREGGRARGACSAANFEEKFAADVGDEITAGGPPA